MHFIKSTISLGFVFSFLIGYSQQAVLTTGGDIIGSSGSISYSIGQVSYEHADGTGASLTEGVQQPYEFFVVSIDESMLQASISLFPNPTMNDIHIQMENLQDGLSVSVFDMTGKLMAEAPLLSSLTSLHVQEWAAGSYIIYIKGRKNEASEFLFIKN